ncbi:MAG: hypothetical protein M9892_08935 [Bacteroidetes bacterium]|nr:hypothetical protein [Bacteroidota bacterium]
MENPKIGSTFTKLAKKAHNRLRSTNMEFKSNTYKFIYKTTSSTSVAVWAVFTTLSVVLTSVWATSKTLPSSSKTQSATSKSVSATSKSHTLISKNESSISTIHVFSSKTRSATSKSQSLTSKNASSTLTDHFWMLPKENRMLTKHFWMLPNKVLKTTFVATKAVKVSKKWFENKSILPQLAILPTCVNGYSHNAWRIIRTPIFMYFIRDRP